MGLGSNMEGTSAPANRRDPYEVLSVLRDSSDQEIKTAYRKLALKSVSFFSIPYLNLPLFVCVCLFVCVIGKYAR